jgi:hypothetical protein
MPTLCRGRQWEPPLKQAQQGALLCGKTVASCGLVGSCPSAGRELSIVECRSPRAALVTAVLPSPRQLLSLLTACCNGRCANAGHRSLAATASAHVSALLLTHCQTATARSGACHAILPHAPSSCSSARPLCNPLPADTPRTACTAAVLTSRTRTLKLSPRMQEPRTQQHASAQQPRKHRSM